MKNTGHLKDSAEQALPKNLKKTGGYNNIPDRGIDIVNAYTLIAVLYCFSSSILFYVLQNMVLIIIHLLALVGVLANYGILLYTRKINRATNIILTIGTIVVVSLFATGGWANTGFLWPFAYLPFAFFLSERNAAMKWVLALFSSCLVAVVLDFTGVIIVPYSPAALVNYFAAMLIFTVCIFLFQKATARREEFLSYTETLLEAAPDAVIVIDDQGRIIKWNPKSEALFGWSADEVLGKTLSKFIIPHRYREAHDKGLKHFLETGKGPVLGKAIEIQALTKNNIEFHIALSISPAMVHNRHVFIGFIRDITENKKTEEKIKQSGNMFSTLFYKSPVLKAIAEASTGKYIEANDAFAEFFEQTKEFISGKTFEELNMDPHPEERNTTLESLKRNGFARNTETRVVTRTGKTRWVSTNLDRMTLNGKDCFLTAGIDISVKKETEVKIKESENMFSTLFYKSSVMKGITEASTGKYIDANDAFLNFFGRTKEEILGKTARELNLFMHPDERDKIINNFRTDGFARDIETQLNSRNGKTSWVSANIDNINLNGNDCFLIAIIDITRRKEAEEKIMQMNSDLELRVEEKTREIIQGEKKFRDLIENSMDIISITDEHFKTIYRSPSAERITGWTNKEREKLSGVELFHPDDFASMKIAMKEILKNNHKQLHLTFRHKHKNGDYIWLDGMMTNMLHDENIKAIVSNLRDITEKKKAEEVIIQSEKRYRYLFENSPMCMWVIDLSTFKFLDVNELAIQQYGYSHGEFLSMTTLDIRPDEDKELFKQPGHLLEMSGTSYSRGIWNHRKKDGTIIKAEVIGHKITFDGKPARLVVSSDVTQRIKTEEMLKDSFKETSDYKYALDESCIVAITDQEGIIKHANVNFCKISKYTREELIGQDHRIINSGYHSKEFIYELWATITSGKIWKGELKNKAKDGTVYWEDTTIVPLLDKEGKPYQYIAINSDITERKQAAQALYESRQLLSAIIDNSTAVIYVKDLDGRYLLANRCYSELFHLSQQQILGKTDYDFFPKEQADMFRGMDLRTAAADHPVTEEEIVPLDGDLHTYISVKSTLRDNTGKPYAIFGISTDITETIKAGEAIKLAEANYREIFDKANDAIYVHEIESGKVIEVNNRAHEITGYSKEELLTSDPQEFITENPDYTLQHSLNYLQKAAAGEPQLFEWLSKNKDGSHNWLEINLKRATIAGQERILSFFRKINDRKKIQLEIQKLNEDLEQKVIDRTAELQKSNELYTNLFNHNPSSIAINTISDGKLIDVNDAFLQLNGYDSKEDVIGKTSDELNMHVQPEKKAEIDRLLNEDKYIKNLEINMYDKQGNSKWMQLSAIELDIDNVPCLFSVSIDITERKNAEEQLRLVNKELEAFSYSVSHDLRAPLRAVSSYAKIIEEDYNNVFDKEGNRLLEVIQKNAVKMGALIDDLLAFSKLGRKVINGSFIDMTKLTENIFSEIDKTTNDKIKVIINPLYPVIGDYSLISQVMTNLISNAIKYSAGAKKSYIEISSEKKDGELIYSVSDNGAGFDMQYVHKLFEVFQRLHTAEEFEGTGVGLAIVKRIINKHKGRVWADGEPGKGATFYFSLPDLETNKNN